jgi:hypothetical protein
VGVGIANFHAASGKTNFPDMFAGLASVRVHAAWPLPSPAFCCY